MRFASRQTDYWELLSAVQRNATYPQFWISPEAERSSMAVGDIAQLLFDIELWDDQNNEITTQVERMWVCVQSTRPWGCLGILMNQPSCLPEHEDVYLNAGAEIAFTPEHVIEIRRENEPGEYSLLDVVRNPTRRWTQVSEHSTQ